MDIALALEIVGRYGTDNPPTLTELTEARDVIARELRSLRGASNVDVEAALALRQTYDAAAAAVAEAQAAEEASTAEVDSILEGIEDPDQAPANPETNQEPTNVLSAREAIARLNLLGGAAGQEPAPTATPGLQVTDRETDGLEQTSYEVIIGDKVVEDATFRDLAEAFADGRTLRAGKERIARITTEFSGDRTISNVEDKAANTALVDMFVSPEAVSAAGGCCSLPTPIYENPVNISTARPIRDGLVTLGVQGRGAVSFYDAICFPDSGADIWTCEQDAAVDPDDPDTWKDCAEVECGEPDAARVEGVYACLTVGRFQSKFAPEEWEGRLRAVAGLQARRAEVNLFTKMRASVNSTHTGSATGSVISNVIQTLALAVATMRQDERLANVQFDWTAPSWLNEAILSDSIARRLRGSGNVETGEALLREALGDLNVRPIWSPDIDPIENGTADQPYSGDLNPFPDLASTVLYPNGFFTFLDGGQFDMGTEITDLDLLRQNKLAAFAESFEGLLARGCNAKALDIPVEICDTVPCA